MTGLPWAGYECGWGSTVPHPVAKPGRAGCWAGAELGGRVLACGAHLAQPFDLDTQFTAYYTFQRRMDETSF